MKDILRLRAAAWLALAPLVPVSLLAQNGLPPAPSATPAPAAPSITVAVPVAPAPLDEVSEDMNIESPVRTKIRTAEAGVARAHAEVARAMRDVQKQMGVMRLDVVGPNVNRVLVVPAPEATTEDVAQIRGDLIIMSRLLQKAASPDGRARNNFKFDFGNVGRRDLDALYVEGSGAVFLLNVDFPFTAPTKDEAKKGEHKDKKDVAWEEASREVAKGDVEFIEEDDDNDDDPGRGFDAGKVEHLKERVLEALRSTTNVRAIKSGEKITVQVLGRSNGKATSRATVARNAKANADGREPVIWLATTDRVGGAGASVMTFQVTRKDVEALNEGKLNADDFAKKVTVTVRDEPEGNGPAMANPPKPKRK